MYEIISLETGNQRERAGYFYLKILVSYYIKQYSYECMLLLYGLTQCIICAEDIHYVHIIPNQKEKDGSIYLYHVEILNQ